MSDKPVYIIAILGAGTMIGVPIGAIAAANILQISIGEGWGSIVGALLGVFGAFLVANFSFNRNLKARDLENRQPIIKRYDYLLKSIERITKILIAEQILPTEFYAGIMSTRHKLVLDQDQWRKGLTICLTADSIKKELSHAKEECFWMLENKSNNLSPQEVREIKIAIKYFDDANRSIETKSDPRSDMPLDKDFKAKFNQVEFACGIDFAYSHIKTARSLHPT